MTNIKPTEKLLTGNWIFENGKMSADDVTARIESLVASKLKQISQDSSGWDVLYSDPADGRLWELVYPRGEMHGGGPPELRCLTADEASRKYGLEAVEDPSRLE